MPIHLARCNQNIDARPSSAVQQEAPSVNPQRTWHELHLAHLARMAEAATRRRLRAMVTGCQGQRVGECRWVRQHKFQRLARHGVWPFHAPGTSKAQRSGQDTKSIWPRPTPCNARQTVHDLQIMRLTYAMQNMPRRSFRSHEPSPRLQLQEA